MITNKNPNIPSLLFRVGVLLLVVLAACSPKEDDGAEDGAVGPVDSEAHLYRLFIDGPSEGEIQVRRFYGKLRLADFETIFAESIEQDEEGRYIGGPVIHEGLIWTMNANPSTHGVNVISIGPDGTVSSSTDLDGDRVVDIADILYADGRHITFMTEGLGMEVFEGLLEGRNRMCDVEFIQTFDMLPFGCPGSSDGGGGSSSDRGFGFYDPWEAMCSEYGSSGISSRVAGHDRASYSTESFHYEDMPSTGGYFIQTTEITYDDDGNHIMTEKLTSFYDGDGNLTREATERVDSDGNGLRKITDYKPDGTKTNSEETFITDLDENGDYPSDVQPPHSAPSEGGDAESPPEPREEGDPGPEGDDTAIREMCEARGTWRSGVEQANEQDPSSFSVSCGDVVDAPDSDTCIIIEWAQPEDFAGALQPSDDDGCGEFQDPGGGGNCEATTAMERIRGLSALFALVEFEEFIVCPQVLCDPQFAEVENPEPISGGAPAESVMAADALCWTGPGSEYEVVSSLGVELPVDVIGVGIQEGWLVIDNPIYSGVACWVDREAVALPPGFDLSGLPVFYAPIAVEPPDEGDDDNDKSSGGGSGGSPGLVPPAAPSSLNAVEAYCDSVNGYRVTLTWKDNSNNESGFRIYRNGFLIATVGPNVTKFTTGKIYESGTQSFYVEAYNAAGEAQSNIALEDGCIY